MIRRLSIVLLVLLLIVSVTPSYAWRFVSMADSRGSDNGVNKAVLTKIINQVNAEKADLVIFQGDAVGGSSESEVLSSQMDTWLSIMKKLNCPWYYVPGNHEIKSAVSESVLRAKINQPLNGPPGHAELVFSFDHENAHFVGLNSNHYKTRHKVQTEWLAQDLAKTDKSHIFVMAHEPAYPAGPHKGSSLDAYPKDRDEFWQVMTKAGVGMYFCGHEHLYQRTKRGSIQHVINGTCGAPIYSAEGAIGKYNYVVVDVDGLNVRCRAKDENGRIIDSWEYTVQ